MSDFVFNAYQGFHLWMSIVHDPPSVVVWPRVGLFAMTSCATRLRFLKKARAQLRLPACTSRHARRRVRAGRVRRRRLRLLLLVIQIFSKDAVLLTHHRRRFTHHTLLTTMRSGARQLMLSILVGAVAVCQLLATARADQPDVSAFKVHSISVNHELGGSAHSTSQLHLIQQPDEPKVDLKYYIGLSPAEATSLSSSEVNLKFGPGVLPDQRAVVPLTPEGSAEVLSEDGSVDVTHLYSVALPQRFLEKSDPQANIVTPNITIAVDLLFHKLSEALPKSVAQRSEAALLWEGDAVPRTVYGAGKVRVKARSPHPQIHSYALVPSQAGDDELTTKSGSTITFGPQSNVPSVLQQVPRKARVHYTYDQPIASIVNLQRLVEVSHWGDNLAFQDQVWFRNDGPQLKGHFSRVDHQIGAFYGGVGKNLVSDFGMQLPAGARDAYFVDQIGNVSTSHFRPAAPSVRDFERPSHLLSESQASHLHIQPRYPVMGGWNYTFTIGWNLPLGPGGWGKSLGSNEYSVAVPFWNAIQNIPVGQVSTKIVLPEGAKLLSVDLPFSATNVSKTASESDAVHQDSTVSQQLYTTYLDTIGRQAIVIQKARCGQREGENVYIRYKLNGADHFLKPFSVASLGLVLFSTALVFRRMSSNGK